MSVLDRSALVDSPLADLHAIATELSIDGFRRLRRPELVEAILVKQGGSASPSEASAPTESIESTESTESTESNESTDGEQNGARRRRSRGGRGRGRSAATDADAGEADPPAPAKADAVETDDDAEPADAPKPRRPRSRSRAGASEETPSDTAASEETSEKPARSRRSRVKATEDEPEPEPTPVASASEDEVVEGVVELLPNGSGFVRVAGPDPSDDDVYISSAQVKRCELVSGDTVAGPKRAPRRSERFASLIRVETINGRPASEVADNVRFDDLPSAWPTVRIKVGSEDPTLKAIEWLTPFGRGSRVTITGASRAGKTEALRRLAAALTGTDGLSVSIALAGVRPEEISEWSVGTPAPTAAVSFAASEDVQSSTLEPVVDQARRLAARGEHAVVLIDTLDGLSPSAARKLMASARNITGGGSVTIIATATAPVGGETTVIALDVGLTSIGRFPSIDLLASGSLKPELLVGDAGAEAIARTRAEVSDDDEN